MILVDTSAWIEFDRATGSPVDVALTAMITGGGAGVAVTEPVLMEVLAGAKTDGRHDDLRRLLMSFAWIPCDPIADFEGAARLYRSCRAAGITPRGLIDCMISSIAIRTSSSVLAMDGDFDQIRRVAPLRLAARDGVASASRAALVANDRQAYLAKPERVDPFSAEVEAWGDA